MESLKAIDVADWFISRANREKEESYGEGISNLKLQKVLYFAQAAHLALEGDELFTDEIYAWNYGPVIKDVYHAYKDNESTAIDVPKHNDYKAFDEKTVTFLDSIWGLFGKYSAAKLVDMTHAHDPWKNVFDGSKDNIITKPSIKKYYQNIFVRT
jgi:uncharacterized phage-associated protein